MSQKRLILFKIDVKKRKREKRYPERENETNETG